MPSGQVLPHVQAERRVGLRVVERRRRGSSPRRRPWPPSSSAGWKHEHARRRPGSFASATSRLATPSRMLTWQSWPHACILPSLRRAVGVSFSSWIGSASMSARSSTVLPGRPPRHGRDHAGAADAGARLEAERAQPRGDDAGGAHLLEADLGMRVQVAPHGDELVDGRAGEVGVAMAHGVPVPRGRRREAAWGTDARRAARTRPANATRPGCRGPGPRVDPAGYLVSLGGAVSSFCSSLRRSLSFLSTSLFEHHELDAAVLRHVELVRVRDDRLATRRSP